MVRKVHFVGWQLDNGLYNTRRGRRAQDHFLVRPNLFRDWRRHVDGFGFCRAMDLRLAKDCTERPYGFGHKSRGPQARLELNGYIAPMVPKSKLCVSAFERAALGRLFRSSGGELFCRGVVVRWLCRW